MPRLGGSGHEGILDGVDNERRLWIERAVPIGSVEEEGDLIDGIEAVLCEIYSLRSLYSSSHGCSVFRRASSLEGS